MYEILSNLPESVAYTCVNCTERHPAEWRLALEKELQISLKQVLTALLNSRTTSHLLRYRQVGPGVILYPENLFFGLSYLIVECVGFCACVLLNLFSFASFFI